MYSTLINLVILAAPMPLGQLPPQAPPVIHDRSYSEARREAVKMKAPLIVFVDCQPPTMPDYDMWGVVCQVRSGKWFDMTGETLTGIAIGLPFKDDRRADLPANVSWDRINKEVLRLNSMREESEVGQVAVPFLPGERLLDVLPVADSSEPPASWPVSVPFLNGLRPFSRARYTQETFNKGTIRPVSRETTLRKWQVSGGMEHVSTTLWKSEVFKLVPGGYHMVYKQWVPVFNGSTNQDELAYVPNYPDGTVFVDMLTNRESGKVFEHRVAEKQNGKWRRYVAYRDKEARPAGYNGLVGMTCTTCHNSETGPGTGGYAVGLVAGGDTIFSDPFPRLER